MNEPFDPMLIVERAEAHLAELRDVGVRNSMLAGEMLRQAARDLIRMADGFKVASADESGERVIGAALAMSDRVVLLDRTVRSDGKNVLLVSGFTAGDVGRARAVSMAWSTGAARIELAVMSPCIEQPGPTHCDRITVIGAGDPADMDLAAEFEAVGWRFSTKGIGYVRHLAPGVPVLGESVIIPYDESAPDYPELRAEAVHILRVARATFFARTDAVSDGRDGQP